MKSESKKLLSHLYVILFFLLISLIYFSPVLEGKKLEQHDIAQWEGMSKEIQDFREKYGEEPLWTRSMFGGMPAYQISVLYPANLLKYVNDILFLGLPTPVNYLFLSLLGFYLLLLAFRVEFKLAATGAIASAFASYNFIIIMAGHNSKIHALALVPLVIAGIIMVLRGKYLTGGIVTAVSLGLQIYANHLQITYYLAIAIFILLIAELIKAVREKHFDNYVKSGITLLLAVILAVLPNITSLWSTYEYGKYSTRGPSELTEKKVSTGLDKDYALGWSYGKSETLTLLVPGFMGGASSVELGTNSATYKALNANGAGAQAKQFIQNIPLYWGDQSFTSGPVYAGAIVIFLFVLGLFLVKGEIKWWLATVTFLFILLSWGKNFIEFTNIFFDYVPGYNKFRAVTIILGMLSLTIPLLGILGLGKLFDPAIPDMQRKKALKNSFYITGGICLLLLILPGLFGDFSSPVDENFKQYDWLVQAIREDRQSALQMDAFRSLFFIGASFALLWFTIKGKIKYQYAIPVIAILTLVDLWAVDKRYLNNDNFTNAARVKQPFQPTAADLSIMQDKEPGYRVMNTSVSTFQDASTSYFHHSIGGYHGAKLKRYQELIEYQISKNNMAVLDMLNTRYFILPSQEGGPPEAQRNPGALGAAWYIKEIKVVANADSEMAALTGFNPAVVAITDKKYDSYLSGFRTNFDSSASIKLENYLANHLTYQTQTSTEQFAVFSEIYYDKGWNAYLDGRKVPHIRVNYVLRGMRVPAGNHKIEFKFEPEVYQTGEKIALAGSIILLLLFGFSLLRELKSFSGKVTPPK